MPKIPEQRHVCIEEGTQSAWLTKFWHRMRNKWCAVGHVDHHHPIRPRVGERPQQDPVHQAEHGGGGADAEGQHQQGGGAEPAIPAQTASPVAEIPAVRSSIEPSAR